jgi:hypothetical protein
MKPFLQAVLKPQIRVGKSSYFLSCDPYLAIIADKLCMTATAINNRGNSVRITWKLTPVYKDAIQLYCSADERNEIVLAVLNDMDGAAEWDEPHVVEQVL